MTDINDVSQQDVAQQQSDEEEAVQEELTPQEIAEQIAETSDADVVIYNGILERDQDRFFIETCERRAKRTNVLLVLVTEGGDAHCAFRIARCLQNHYQKFTVFVPGYCKSAGTLLALGAHEIVMSEHGELGPLDVQDNKKDDLFGTQSGLTAQNAIAEIRQQAFEAFEQYFVTMMIRSRNRIALRTATNVASSLVTGMFSPLLEKLDPLYVGEIARASAIARDYGIRLLERSTNMNIEQLDQLITEYNSHHFVIDQVEAERLFVNLRSADSIERELARNLGEVALWPQAECLLGECRFAFLSVEAEQRIEHGTENNQGNLESGPRTSAK